MEYAATSQNIGYFYHWLAGSWAGDPLVLPKGSTPKSSTNQFLNVPVLDLFGDGNHPDDADPRSILVLRTQPMGYLHGRYQFRGCYTDGCLWLGDGRSSPPIYYRIIDHHAPCNVDPGWFKNEVLQNDRYFRNRTAFLAHHQGNFIGW